MVRGFRISEFHPGLYYIEGDAFSIQIIESKKLTADINVFLKNLRSSLTQKDMEEVFQAYKKFGALENAGIYLSRILEANQSVLKEVLDMGGTAVRDIISDFIKKNGIEDQIRENKARDTALEMIKDGCTPDKIALYVQMPIEWVHNLTK